MPFPAEVIQRYRESGEWGDQTIYATFLRNAGLTPDRLAIVDAPNREVFALGAPRRLSYLDLADSVRKLAAALRAQGLHSGDIILVQMPNVHELVVLYLAAASVGVVVSPVPIQYRRAELQAIVDVLQPVAFCSVSKAARTNPLELFISEVAFGGLILSLDGSSGPGVVDIKRAAERLANPDEVLADVTPVSPDQLFSICWTSGTEGKPKGVPKTHNNWLSSAQNAQSKGWLPVGGRILAPFPLVNAAAFGGLLMSWLGAAGTLVMHHPFDLNVFLNQIEQERIDYTLLAPALLTRIAEKLAAQDTKLDLSSLRAIGTGSAPINPDLLRRMETLLPVQIVNIFGSNEGLQLCSDETAMPDQEARATTFPRDGDLKRDATSRTVNGSRFMLVDPLSERPVTDVGQVGEMVIQGPAVFPGYFDRGGFDRSDFTSDGFFRTGDLFKIVNDAAGYPDAISFVGRQKELIIRGGMKIAPTELDAALAAHPAVKEAAVAAWMDERLGERVCAFVVLQPGLAITLDELCVMMDQQGIARFKWPERLMLLEALPRNAMAKLQRSALTALLNTADVHACC